MVQQITLSETQVNTGTSSRQLYPNMTTLINGDFIITWHRQGTSGYDVFAQRYDASGSPIGNEFSVNKTTSFQQYDGYVTALIDGGFVVTWHSQNQDGSLFGIYGQRYDVNGNKVGTEEFQVNTTSQEQQFFSSVTTLTDGGFLVTWASNYDELHGGVGDTPKPYVNNYSNNNITYNTPYVHDIFAQRYDANGNAVGGEFRVNTSTGGNQFFQDVTALVDGGFVVVWHSDHNNGKAHQYDVYGQRYDASGNKVGSEFQVNTDLDENLYTHGGMLHPSVTALQDGGFVVVWEADIGLGTLLDIYGQRYDANGKAIGTNFQVSEYNSSNSSLPDVVSLADGSFIITWQTWENGSLDVRARLFNSFGHAVSDEFRVNITTEGDQRYAEVTALDDGGFVIAWSDNDNKIFARRFPVENTTIEIEPNYADTPMKNYAGQMDSGDRAAVWMPFDTSANDGSRLVSMYGDVWRSTDVTYTVTENSYIEFDYQTKIEGDIHGIGLDTNNNLSRNDIIQLDGSESWGRTGFEYTGTATGATDDFQHFTIKLSKYFSVGTTYTQLVFVNDDNTGNINALSDFKNIRFVEHSVIGSRSSSALATGIEANYDDTPMKNYAGQVDSGDGAAVWMPFDTVENDGSRLVSMYGDVWRSTDITYKVTGNTYIEFDYQTKIEGDIHGIGLDTDNTLSRNDIIQLDGSQSWGQTGFEYTGTATGSTDDFQHFKIKLSKYFALGTYTQLVFVNDDNTGNINALSDFKNIRFVEEGTEAGGYHGVALENIIDFDQADIDSLGDNQYFQVDDFEQADKLDISDILVGYESGDQISDFLMLAHNGSDTTVSVDVDGTENGINFQSIAVVTNTILDINNDFIL